MARLEADARIYHVANHEPVSHLSLDSNSSHSLVVLVLAAFLEHDGSHQCPSETGGPSTGILKVTTDTAFSLNCSNTIQISDSRPIKPFIILGSARSHCQVTSESSFYLSSYLLSNTQLLTQCSQRLCFHQGSVSATANIRRCTQHARLFHCPGIETKQWKCD